MARKKKDETTDEKQGPKRVPKTIYMSEDLVDRVRSAATALAAYHPESEIRSLSDIFEPGVLREVERLEKKYNGGQQFPRVARMKTGRPMD